MDHRFIQDNQIVDLYLSKRLDRHLEENFETHFLRCAVCQQDIRWTEPYLTALTALDRAEFLPERNEKSWRNLALAASVLLATSLGYSTWSFKEANQLRGRLSDLSLSTNSIVVMPLAMARSASEKASNVIELTDSPQWFIMELEGFFESDAQYQVQLDERQGATVWQTLIKPDYRDLLVIALPSSLLQSDLYDVWVSKSGDAHGAQRFALEVRGPDYSAVRMTQ